MNPLTHLEFQNANKADSYLDGRWEYYAEAIRIALTFSPASVLELGPGPLPLFSDSLLFDVDPKRKPLVQWDATKTPWPLGSKCVDVFIALQTFEHLKQAQAKAFKEAVRVARKAVIISIPYKWTCDDFHNGLDETTVAAWTGRPFERMIILPPAEARRAMFVFTL